MVEKPGEIHFFNDEALVKRAFQIVDRNGWTHIPLPEEVADIPELWFHDLVTAGRIVARQRKISQDSKEGKE